LVVKGAQGNFAFDKASAWTYEKRFDADGVRNDFQVLSGAPCLTHRDPAVGLASMSKESLMAMVDAIPPGVLFRHRSSVASPPAIPDLIGIKNRRFLDKSGLVRHRGIGDLK
jgi:hypothetical protein